MPINDENRQFRTFYNLRLWRDGLQPDQLLREPLCRRCRKQNRLIVATVVNHIVAHKGKWELFSDINNLESLCKSCHDGDAQREDKNGYSSMVGADGWPMDHKHPLNRRTKP